MAEDADPSGQGGVAESRDASTEPSPGSPLPAFLDVDEVFEAIDHPRRRYLVFSLLVEDQPVALVDVATELHAWEESIPVDDVDPEDAKPVMASLYHVHVPKLRTLGIVTYDEQERRVAPGQNTAHVRSFVDDSTDTFDSVEDAHDRYATTDHDDVE